MDDTNGQPDLSTGVARADFLRNLARNVVMRLGYRYRTATFGAPPSEVATRDDLSTSEHGLDFGLDYTRRLSATRRLVLGTTVGPSVVSAPGFLPDGTDSGKVYRASTSMTLGYELKTWQLRGGFYRGMEYVPQLRQPVYVTGFSADVTALASARLDVTAGGRYSGGGSVLSLDAMTLDTYSADVRVRYALTSTLAAYGEYLYYFYDFRGAAEFGPGVPRALERNGVRAGLTLWVPALRR